MLKVELKTFLRAKQMRKRWNFVNFQPISSQTQFQVFRK
jgi:hypothetical protein